MANAAAKKAAAARASTSSTYLPIVYIINAIYFGLRVVLRWSTFDRFQIAMSLILWILTFVAYRGIVEDSATNQNSKSLAGGASLDLLGVVVLIQFGSVLWSDNFYWILAGPLPAWGVWRLYSTVKGMSSPSADSNFGGGGSGFFGGGANQEAEDKEEDKDLAEKRRKRAERRRQKWS